MSRTHYNTHRAVFVPEALPAHALLPAIAQERLRLAASIDPFPPGKYADSHARRKAVDKAIANIRTKFPKHFISEE